MRQAILRLTSALALALVLAAPTPAAAQSRVDSSVVAAGSRVRILMRDTTTLLGRTRRVGSTGVVEGTLVALHQNEVTVRVGRGYNPNDYTDFTIPYDNMRSLEGRVDAGPCERNAAARALCVVGGLSAGAAVGYLGGRQIGNAIGQDAEPGLRADSETKYGTRGLLIGAAIGALVANSLGRHTWAPLWTRPGDEQ